MLMLISLIISSSMIIIMMILKMNKLYSNEKSTSFECGFDMISMTRLPFSIHFFMICLIFLIFDVEICLVLPLIYTKMTSMKLLWITTTILFTVILTWGLMHEWTFESLKWKFFLSNK